MRLGELNGLKVGDINLEKKVISVSRSIDTRNGTNVGPTKSKRSRFVPISDSILPTLEKLIHKRKPDEWLFYNSYTNMPYTRMSTSIKTACKKAGLAEYGITPHYFRYWYATYFLIEGGDPVVLMKSLGHREFKTTLKHYEHYGIENLVNQRNIVSIEINNAINPNL